MSRKFSTSTQMQDWSDTGLLLLPQARLAENHPSPLLSGGTNEPGHVSYVCVCACVCKAKLPVCLVFLSVVASSPKHIHTNTHTPAPHCYPLTDHWHAVSRPSCSVYAYACVCVLSVCACMCGYRHPPTEPVWQLPFLKELRKGGSME